jgi:cysteine desulfurase
VLAAAVVLAAALTPLHCARAQERGIRSGTVPAPLAVGFGAACAIAQREMAADHAHVTALARRLYDGITSRLQVRQR